MLVTLVVLIAGGAVVAALFGDDSPLRHPGLKNRPVPPLRPGALRSVSFSTRFRGYDPVEVDQWLAAAADAWEALAEVAGEELLALADEELQLASAPDEDGLRHGLAWLDRITEPSERVSGEELQDGGSDPTGVLDR